MQRIAPGPASQALNRGVYTVEASGTLPTISSSKTIKVAWLPPGTLSRYNRFVRRWRLLLNALFLVSEVVGSAAVFVSANAARTMVYASAPLAIPTLSATFLSLRYDMVVLLLGCFDFWYRSLAVGVGTVVLAFYIGDARAQTMLGIMGGILILQLMDANFRATKSIVGILLISASMMFLIASSVASSLVDDVNDFTVLHIHDHTVTARSIITNSYSLSGVLMLHNAYVRHTYTKRTTSQTLTTTSKCVLYRCRLKWLPVSGHSRLAIERREPKRTFDGQTIQLRCPGLRQAFNARKTLVPTSKERCFKPYTCVFRFLFLVSGIVGVVCTIATFLAVASMKDPSNTLVRTFSIVSFITTITVNGFFISFVYQVEMLRLLYTSFDFVFYLSQVILAHLCLCDLCSWDVRVYAIISSLLWMHWASTIDAIPPIKRRQLGLNVRRVSALIQISFLAAMALFSVDLLTWHSQGFVNRDVLHDIGYRKSLSDSSGDQRTANWSVGSLFLNRVVGLALWIGRSVYHIATYEEDELVSLRGRVEFDDYEAARREQRRESSKAKVGAIVQALSDRSQISYRNFVGPT